VRVSPSGRTPATEGEPSGRDLRRLPADLREATDAFAGSELARDTLGDQLVDLVVANKRAEWDAYQSTVSPWELERFLRLL
jgi:glutamine synthetase